MKIRKVSRRSGSLKLDLTPLIDVVFLLLIFFMLGTSFIDINAGVKIDLPQSSIEEISDFKEILIAIDKDIDHGTVVQIMTKAKNAGALSLDIAASKEE